MRKVTGWLLLFPLSLSAPALALTRGREAPREQPRVKAARVAGYRGVGHAHNGMPEELQKLASSGASLREILFGKNAKLTSESFVDERQGGAGDCYSQSTRAELVNLSPMAEQRKFVGLKNEDGKLVAVDLSKHPDFVPEIHDDGTFEVGLVQYKPETHEPYIRAVLSKFPVSKEGKLVMANLRDDSWWAIFAEQARADAKGGWDKYANGGEAAREMEAETGLKGETFNVKLTGHPVADTHAIDAAWDRLVAAKGHLIVAGTDDPKDSVNRLKAEVADGLLKAPSERQTWASTHMIDDHDQSVLHVGVDPELQKDAHGKVFLRDGKPVVAQGEDGKPVMHRFVYMRNPWGSTVMKGEEVIDPLTGKNEGMYRMTIEKFVAFYSQYYIGGNPKDMKKVNVGELEIARN